MQIDADRLASWLRTAGSATEDDRSPARNLAEQLYETEVRRSPDPNAATEIESWWRSGVDGSEIHRRVRSSLEAAHVRSELLGECSATFRHLSATAAAGEREIAPQIVAECIAAYRVIFGREPDATGFLTFADERSTSGLIDVLRFLLGAAEAEPFVRAGGVDIAQLCSTVTAMSVAITGAASDDVMHRTVVEIAGRIASLDARLEALERTLQDFVAFVRLTLGAHP